MTWPTVAVVTTNLDAAADSPASARSDLLDAVQKLNQQIAHVSTFMATVLDDVSASAARATLGSTTVGDAVFIAATAAAGRTALAAAASGANTDITSITGTATNATNLTGSGTISATTTATTQAVATNNTTVATTAYVKSNLIGTGQTWQDMTASRATATTYTNSTGRAIVIYLAGTWSSGSVVVNGITLDVFTTQNAGETFIVPDTNTYRVNGWTGTTSAAKWLELR